MDSGNYVCDVLYYITGTWWSGDNDKITNYSGYPENIYNDLSNENEQKRGDLLWMDQIGLCQCDVHFSYGYFKNKLLLLSKKWWYYIYIFYWNLPVTMNHHLLRGIWWPIIYPPFDIEVTTRMGVCPYQYVYASRIILYSVVHQYIPVIHLMQVPKSLYGIYSRTEVLT